MTLFRFASRMLASLQLTQTTPSLRKLMPTPFHSSPLAKANKSGPLAHRRSRVATQALSGGGVSTQQVPAMTETKFLDALEGAEQTCGVYLLKKFLSETEADSLYATLNSDSNFPWDLKPKYAGQVLEQHACEFYRGRKDIQKWPGASTATGLCNNVSQELLLCNIYQESHALFHVLAMCQPYSNFVIFLQLITFSEAFKFKFQSFGMMHCSMRHPNLMFFVCSIALTWTASHICVGILSFVNAALHAHCGTIGCNFTP